MITKEELTRQFLIALGVELQPQTNILVDQETKNQLTVEGKFIKANIDPNQTLYISDMDVKFEPLNPKCTKLMEFIFGKFLDDSAEQGFINPALSTFFDYDEVTRKYRLNIVYEGEIEKKRGNWYYNKILCYVEHVFAIDGTFIGGLDLYPFDIDPESDEVDL